MVEQAPEKAAGTPTMTALGVDASSLARLSLLPGESSTRTSRSGIASPTFTKARGVAWRNWRLIELVDAAAAAAVGARGMAAAAAAAGRERGRRARNAIVVRGLVGWWVGFVGFDGFGRTKEGQLID